MTPRGWPSLYELDIQAILLWASWGSEQYCELLGGWGLEHGVGTGCTRQQMGPPATIRGGFHGGACKCHGVACSWA